MPNRIDDATLQMALIGCAPKMADNDDLFRINHHWLPPSVRFDRGAHFGDGLGGPFACVFRVVFRAVNGPHLDVHGFRVSKKRGAFAVRPCVPWSLQEDLSLCDGIELNAASVSRGLRA